MTEASEWTGRVGGTWAQEWQRTDRSFGILTARLLDSVALADFTSALDIGCGAGEIALALANSNPDATITGLDISQDLLSVARARGSHLPNLSFHEGDAALWSPENGSAPPDLLVSRHGVMFFDDPVAAFAHLRSIASDGAELRFSCFRQRSQNRWVELLQGTVPGARPPADPTASGPFAFGESERVRAVLSAAGWNDIGLEPVDYAMIAGEGESALDEAVAYFQRIGPAAGAIADLEGSERERAIEGLRAMLGEHHANGRVALPAAAWIVTASAA